MLVMAPEGTTGDGRCILQFRTGAFVPGVPVLPVCLAYGKRCHNPAWTIVNEPWHFVRALSCAQVPCLDGTRWRAWYISVFASCSVFVACVPAPGHVAHTIVALAFD